VAPFPAAQLYPPLAVFEDALPDAWGRKVMIQARHLPRDRQGAPWLLGELAGHGLGALLFGPPGAPPPVREAGPRGLSELMNAAMAFDRGEALPEPELQRLFAAASSPGGGRPKAIVEDDGDTWIAKFPSPDRDDRWDIVGLEKSAMELARVAGIEVPETRLVDVGTRRALLVRRFDVVPPRGRRHMISLQTLCREQPGNYVQGYTELADAVRKVGAAPQRDVDRLFRYMTFNAAIGNTDDHLKNFWMLHDDAGYRLAPAFDLLPDVGRRREHTLAFLHDRSSPTRNDLLELARRWNVKDAAARLALIAGTAKEFAAVAARNGVPAEQSDLIQRDIERRVEGWHS
jgi:serine/threonine-protein kinase HipA